VLIDSHVEWTQGVPSVRTTFHWTVDLTANAAQSLLLTLQAADDVEG